MIVMSTIDNTMNSETKLYCRLCAEVKNSDKLIDLKVNVQCYEETVHWLKYLNAQYIDMSADNFLPTTICFVCSDALHKAYDFLNTVQRAQTVLTDIFNNKSSYPTSDNGNNDDDDDDDDRLYDEDLSPNDSKVSIKIENDDWQISNVKVEPHDNKEGITSQSMVEMLNAAIDNTIVNSGWFGNVKDEESWKCYNWVCRHCLMEFPDLIVLRLHFKEVHGSCAGFSCADCDTETTNFDQFVEHVREHRSYLKDRCPHCDALMTGPEHISEHFTKSQLPCHLCGEILKDKHALEKHTSLYPLAKKRKKRRKPGEPISADDLTCHHCDKVYKNKNSLRDHQKLHTKERKRNFTCDRCGKAFYNKGTLTSHILLIHESARPHQCRICSKTFLFPNMLRRHVEMHSGVKPFSCEQCGRCFRLKYQLKSHQIIHTDQMPFMCQFCSKSFKFKQILINHERQHTGARPYSCESCHMEFTNWSNYNKHMKRRHGTDMSKKKITPVGIFPVNPGTGEIVQIDDPIATEEWKSRIMIPGKRGRKGKRTNM